MNRPVQLLGSGLSALAACLLLSSCSAFESSKKMDMTPFSQNAGMMYAEAAKINTPFQFRELQRYLNEPEIVELQSAAVPVLIGWQGLVRYSNQLVALNNAKLSESQKNQKLAEYILQTRQRLVDRGAVENIEFEFGGLDSVLMNIRSAPTFLDGIDAAAPIVNSVVYAMQSQIDKVSSLVPGVGAAFQRRIEADQEKQKGNYLDLRELQARFHHAQVLLYRARLEEPGAFDSLLQVDPSLKEYLNPKGGTSGKNWKDAEEALALRLARIHESFNQLSMEGKVYQARQQEVQEWREEINMKIKVARDGLMVWSQSHHNLGKGIPVPPLIDVMSMAGGLAKKVVPLP